MMVYLHYRGKKFEPKYGVVVLSACNTAAMADANVRAIPDLAHAFFAGSRSVLVSNWSIESTSAALLTSTAFKELSANNGISCQKHEVNFTLNDQ